MPFSTISHRPTCQVARNITHRTLSIISNLLPNSVKLSLILKRILLVVFDVSALIDAVDGGKQKTYTSHDSVKIVRILHTLGQVEKKRSKRNGLLTLKKTDLQT